MGFLGSTVIFLGIMLICGAAMISNSMDESRKEFTKWREMIDRMRTK